MQEAAELRPLLVSELTTACDLLLRDRARKAYVLLSARLQPRLPFIGALPAPPAPPIFVPGKGLMQSQAFIDTFFPRLTDGEEITLDTQLGLAAAILGVEPQDIGEVSAASAQKLLLNPSAQIRELQAVLAKLAGDAGDLSVIRSVSMQVASNLVERLSVRAEVPRDTLFPMLPRALQAEQQLFERNVAPRLTPEQARAAASAVPATPRSAPAVPAAAARGARQQSAQAVPAQAQLDVVAGGVQDAQLQAIDLSDVRSNGADVHVGRKAEAIRAELQSSARGRGQVGAAPVVRDTVDEPAGEGASTVEIKRDGPIRMIKLEQRRRR